MPEPVVQAQMVLGGEVGMGGGVHDYPDMAGIGKAVF
jgi:hypothetical protein